MRAHRWLWVAPALLFLVSSRAADHSVEPITSRIERESVQSSALAAVGYSRRLHALEIEFRDGLVYRYLEVPVRIHCGLISADSKARFYNKQVRGRYRCLRVRPRHLQ
ncbi:MAG: KTSC domain-containing protein [Chthoniobacterales bacterium]|nr:KTSC domain-containing protein [Chthoniobacterales bacterium]